MIGGLEKFGSNALLLLNDFIFNEELFKKDRLPIFYGPPSKLMMMLDESIFLPDVPGMRTLWRNDHSHLPVP